MIIQGTEKEDYKDFSHDGIDFSEAMVAKLRAKPGGEKLSVTMGNYAHYALRVAERA